MSGHEQRSCIAAAVRFVHVSCMGSVSLAMHGGHSCAAHPLGWPIGQRHGLGLYRYHVGCMDGAKMARQAPRTEMALVMEEVTVLLLGYSCMKQPAAGAHPHLTVVVGVLQCVSHYTRLSTLAALD
jgi:hypothetical protein